MSPFFEKRKKEYMDLLFNVSAQGSWEAWIRFCLEGVVLQSIDAERRCDKLLKLQNEFPKTIKGGSVRLSQLIDDLFFRPIITVSQYKTRFGVTYPTARLDLKKLEQAGIVQPLEGLDTITYYSSAIYRITYEDIDP
jgi:Fic family protein